MTQIYHNPRCSKSRQTLALLEEQGLDFEIIKYLDDAPSADTLKAILSGLNMQPRELMRKGESEYKAQNLSDENLSVDDLITAMVTTPKLIERPIVIHNGHYAIGRPPESVLELFK